MLKILNSFPIKRSVLYDVRPIGIGTTNIESLTSYLIRLSSEHCVFPGVLINDVISQHLGKGYLLSSKQIGGNRFYDLAKTINGYMENSIALVEVLESLTCRNDFKLLTLSNLKHVVPVRGLLKESIAWCPTCLNEMNEYDFLYYPLLWFLKDVDTCPIHAVMLCNKCPGCNENIDILHRKSIIGYCPNCFVFLGEAEICEDFQNRELRLWIANNIAKLLAFTTEISQEPERKRHAEVLEMINKTVFEGKVSRFAKAVQIPTTTLSYWIKGIAIPPLSRQLQICFTLGLTLTDYLYKECPEIIRRDLEQCEEFANKKVKKRKQDDHDLELLEKQLIHYLRCEDICSMSEVAKKIGVNKRLLYKYFPEICHEIAARNKDYLTKRKEQRINEAILKVEAAVEDLFKQGVYPSRRKVEAYLNQPAILRERVVQDSWKSLLNSYGRSDVKC